MMTPKGKTESKIDTRFNQRSQNTDLMIMLPVMFTYQRAANLRKETLKTSYLWITCRETVIIDPK